MGNFARLSLGGCQPGLLPLSPDVPFSRSRGVTLALQLTAFPALSCSFRVSFHTGISKNGLFSYLIPSWYLLLRRPHLQLQWHWGCYEKTAVTWDLGLAHLLSDSQKVLSWSIDWHQWILAQCGIQLLRTSPMATLENVLVEENSVKEAMMQAFGKYRLITKLYFHPS